MIKGEKNPITFNGVVRFLENQWYCLNVLLSEVILSEVDCTNKRGSYIEVNIPQEGEDKGDEPRRRVRKSNVWSPKKCSTVCRTLMTTLRRPNTGIDIGQDPKVKFGKSRW